MTSPSAVLGVGGVVIFKKCFKNGSIPKFVRAEPKHTGDNLPARTASKLNSFPAISSNSISSCNLSYSSSSTYSFNLGSSAFKISVSTSFFPPSTGIKRITSLSSLS